MIYFLIAIGATTVGSLTGMGGGVIIKPLMDVLHDFDVQTIGVISSLTVFSMSVVSIGKQMLAKTKIPFGTAIPLALGSVVGGLAGEKLLHAIVEVLQANSAVTVVQNVVLSLLILAVFLYMKNKSHIPSKHLEGVVVSLLVGVFLGICSSFLGIGGGPINVALIIYLFSFDTKSATVCSLVTILFAQISKLGTVALTTGFGIYDKIGGIAGAGSIVPRTGFANSIASPGMEFRKEGIIFGLMAKMFVIAGPVIVTGVVSSVIVGIIYTIVAAV